MSVSPSQESLMLIYEVARKQVVGGQICKRDEMVEAVHDTSPVRSL